MPVLCILILLQLRCCAPYVDRTVPGHPSAFFRFESPERVNATVILDRCDRLVLARVESVREFARKPGSLGKEVPPPIRIARLQVLETPFGSMSERLLVRLPEDAVTPEGVALWPLGENLLTHDDDWDAFARISKELGADPLWMPSSPLHGPWPVRIVGSKREVQMSRALILGTDQPAAPQASDPQTPLTKWIDLQTVSAVVIGELVRVAPRIEARVSSNAPVGWSVVVDKNGTGVGPDGVSFQWDDEARSNWRAALTRAGFPTLPRSLGDSGGTCEAIEVMSFVTSEGRKTVRLRSSIPNDATPEEVRSIGRMRELWTVLESLVPER